MKPIENLVLVHRLREVMALTGFTRFEARSADIEGEDDLGVEPARLALEADWLPAVANRGEGIFLSFKRTDINEWLQREAVKQRETILEAGCRCRPATRPAGTL